MLEAVKRYIEEQPDIPFDIYYQGYICDVQDQNIVSEINGLNIGEMMSVSDILNKLHQFGG